MLEPHMLLECHPRARNKFTCLARLLIESFGEKMKWMKEILWGSLDFWTPFKRVLNDDGVLKWTKTSNEDQVTHL
jgi:hypothetical protein